MSSIRLIALSLVAAQVCAQTYSATYLPSNAPAKTEKGQSGTNQCGTTASQSSMCQNLYINSVDDFCLFAPPQPGAGSAIGSTERIEVAWCLKDGYGTRLIPDGALGGVHFVQTPDYVQITGVGDLTKLNIPAGDEGGELDPHGADGNGNPIGGLVFSNAFGNLAQIHEWTNFMSANEFCIRACKDGPKAPALCNHIYDVMGCMWNMPANYNPGVFESCKADSGEPMGVYGKSTFHQGEPATPAGHPAPSSSQCTSLNTLAGGGQATLPPATTTSSASGSTSTSSSSGSSASNTSSGVSTSTGTKPTSTSGSSSTSNSGSAPGPSKTGSPNSGSLTGVSFSAVIAMGGFVGAFLAA